MSTSDAAEMLYIPAGWFLQGSRVEDGDPDERPQRRVYLDGFWLDKTEVTNRRYERFVRATGHRPPLYWFDGKIPDGREEHPVVGVSWEDARAYALWAGKDLPTEAQWEKAARGVEGALFPWGNEWEPQRANLSGKPAPVGSHPRDISPYGCVDMTGNVWEWCRDWYNLYLSYADQPERNPSGVEEWRRYWYRGTHYRVVRGGYYTDGRRARAADRLGDVPPQTRYWAIGFRCASPEVPERVNLRFQTKPPRPQILRAPAHAVRQRTGRLEAPRLPSFEIQVDHPVIVAQSKGWENGDIGMYHYMTHFERLGDGRLALSFGMHPDATGPYPPIDTANLGLGAVRVSGDEGRSWKEPEPPMAMMGMRLADGSLVSIHMHTREQGQPAWSPYAQGRVRDDQVLGTVQISRDAGRAVEVRREISVDLGGMSLTRIHLWPGGFVQTPEGDILAVAGCNVKGEDWWRNILLRSADGGQSWRYVSTVMGRSQPGHGGFSEECALASCGDAELLAVVRTQRNATPLRRMAQARSLDRGKTWSEPAWCPDIPGVLWPFHSGNVSPTLLRLRSGVMVLAYGRPAGLSVAFSADGRGVHWEPLTLIGALREGLLEQEYGLMSTHDITIPGNPGAYLGNSSHMPRMLAIAPDRFLLAYDVQSYSPFVIEDQTTKELVAPDPQHPARNTVFVIPIGVERVR